jgi:hypothetical protein
MGDSVGQPGYKSFSNELYKIGDLKRRLPLDTLAFMAMGSVPSAPTTGSFSFRRVLKNLNGGLSIHVAVGVVGLDVSSSIEASFFPALWGTVQLTPVNVFPDAPPLFLRPVFQNPAIANNSNNPLGQDLPFGWEFETEADQVYIDVTVSADAIASIHVVGRLVIEVEIEYTGNWPFPEAVKFMLTQPQLVGGSNPMSFKTDFS